MSRKQVDQAYRLVQEDPEDPFAWKLYYEALKRSGIIKKRKLKKVKDIDSNNLNRIKLREILKKGIHDREHPKADKDDITIVDSVIIPYRRDFYLVMPISARAYQRNLSHTLDLSNKLSHAEPFINTGFNLALYRSYRREEKDELMYQIAEAVNEDVSNAFGINFNIPIQEIEMPRGVDDIVYFIKSREQSKGIDCASIKLTEYNYYGNRWMMDIIFPYEDRLKAEDFIKEIFPDWPEEGGRRIWFGWSVGAFRPHPKKGIVRQHLSDGPESKEKALEAAEIIAIHLEKIYDCEIIISVKELER